jgi:hypothetical protein
MPCVACGGTTRPADDLAGTWTYVDSMHFEVTGVGTSNREAYYARAGRVTLFRAQPGPGEQSRFEGSTVETNRSGSRPIGSSGPFTTADPVTFPRDFAVSTFDGGVRDLVRGFGVVPWTAVRRRLMMHTFVADGECTRIMAPNGDATACTQHIVWARLAH